MNDTEALAWFKSSHSGGEGGDCVEIAAGAGAVHVRDSKDVARPALRVSHDAWAGFVGLASAE
ncbi:DUF397 domain-containing protein [Streptomyces sp. NPDC012825]|uniref:DUF397 domain-containing protein n=1 Tax=Streptomyces sp. NPDC012825 TaxID=3364851 RepID=UPI0036D0EBBB